MARTQQVQHTAGNAIRQKVDAQKAAKRAKRAAALAAAAAAEAEAEAQRAEAEAEAEAAYDDDDDDDDDENYDDDEEEEEDEDEDEEDDDEEEEAPMPSKKKTGVAAAKSGVNVKKSAVQTKAHAAKPTKAKNTPVASKTRVKQPSASASTRVSEKKAKKEPAPAERTRALKKPPQIEYFMKTRANGTEVKMKRTTTFLPNGEATVVERPFRRFHPGTVALRRIREFQRPRSKPYIKRLPLKRVFLEKVQNHHCLGDESFRIQRRAMLLCQEAVESVLIQLVRDSLDVIGGMTKKQTLTADSIYTTALLKHASLIPNMLEYKSQKLPPRSHFATTP